MKTFNLILFLLLSNYAFAQPKDTIYGKIQSIREQVIFLDENRQNMKLFSTEGDYGHNGFVNANYTKNRFHKWWYDTYWTHYINYYKEYDDKGRLLIEKWFNKNQIPIRSVENQYDSLGNIILQRYSDKSYTINKYDNNSKLITSKSELGSDKTVYKYTQSGKVSEIVYPNHKERVLTNKTQYYYDEHDRLVTIKNFDKYGETYGTRYKYDRKNRKIETINHSPYMWVKNKKGSEQKRVKDGNDKICEKLIYDNNDRIIENIMYTEDPENENASRVYTKKVYQYENDLLVREYNYDYSDSLIYYKKYDYNSDHRISKVFGSYNKNKFLNKIYEYSYNEHGNPIQLIYTYIPDKLFIEKGLSKKEILPEDFISKTINFEYTFDENNNWVQQIKSVDGEKLYIWKREIKYLE